MNSSEETVNPLQVERNWNLYGENPAPSEFIELYLLWKTADNIEFHTMIKMDSNRGTNETT